MGDGVGAAMVRDEVPEGARRVLFLTDNGHGLGHVTRLLAIARRCAAELQPVFLTMSTSHRLIAEAGFPVEYFPSPDRWGVQGSAWSALLETKLTSAIRRLAPIAVVVDHVRPSPAMHGLRERFPDLAMIWSRRGLWQPGRNADALDLVPAFDLILEPLDLAAPLDAGLTAVFVDRVLHVPPITLLDPDDLLTKEQARAQLGLDPDRPAALVNLAADDPGELSGLINRCFEVLQGWTGMQVVAPDHALHRGRLEVDDRVLLRSVYPLSRYLAAFDLGVITAGYNSFHETVMAGLPCVFVPRRTSTIDDQQRRAEFASLGGFGWYTSSLDDPAFEAAVALASDPLERRKVKAAMAVVYPGNGAGDAAQAIWSLTHERRAAAMSGSGRRQPERKEGEAGPLWLDSDAERVLVAAPYADETQLRDLIEEVAMPAAGARGREPIFLVPAAAASQIEERGFRYETLLSPEIWAAMKPSESYHEYVQARVRELIDICVPDQVLSVPSEVS